MCRWQSLSRAKKTMYTFCIEIQNQNVTPNKTSNIVTCPIHLLIQMQAYHKILITILCNSIKKRTKKGFMVITTDT